MNGTETPVIVAPDGKPARAKVSDRCPECGRAAKDRVASSGFGAAHPVCVCGHEFFDEVWRG